MKKAKEKPVVPGTKIRPIEVESAVARKAEDVLKTLSRLEKKSDQRAAEYDKLKVPGHSHV